MPPSQYNQNTLRLGMTLVAVIAVTFIIVQGAEHIAGHIAGTTTKFEVSFDVKILLNVNRALVDLILGLCGVGGVGWGYSERRLRQKQTLLWENHRHRSPHPSDNTVSRRKLDQVP